MNLDLTHLRAYADYHRELADKADALILAAEAGEEKPTSPERIGPRFIAASINGIWGVLDSEEPDVWAAFGDDDQESAVDTARELNEGESVISEWNWTPRGEFY